MPNAFASFSFVAVCILASPTSAAAPKGRYEVNSAADIVRDTHTGLVWQRDGSGSAATPEDAIRQCETLSLASFTTGWRLPTRAELLSIVDASTFDPAIDDRAFRRTKSTWYWSRTPPASGIDDLWIVSFYDGAADYSHFDAVPPFGVRCVR